MTHEFTIRRLIDASPDEVFEALTDPAGQRVWWTEGQGSVDSGGEARIGCTTFVEWDTDDGHRCRAEQTYVEIDRPRRLVFKETVFEADVAPYECTLTMTFEDRDGKTSYTLHHVGFPTAEESEKHERGTNVFLDRLTRYVTKTAV